MRASNSINDFDTRCVRLRDTRLCLYEFLNRNNRHGAYWCLSNDCHCDYSYGNSAWLWGLHEWFLCFLDHCQWCLRHNNTEFWSCSYKYACICISSSRYADSGSHGYGELNLRKLWWSHFLRPSFVLNIASDPLLPKYSRRRIDPVVNWSCRSHSKSDNYHNQCQTW